MFLAFIILFIWEFKRVGTVHGSLVVRLMFDVLWSGNGDEMNNVNCKSTRRNLDLHRNGIAFYLLHVHTPKR